MAVKHTKTNTIADWTQTQLDTIIAGGAAPPIPSGTLLANITLPSDWNHDHTIDSGGLTFFDGTTQTTAFTGGGRSNSYSVTQTAHGFSVDDAVYHNNTIYVKANSNSVTTADVIGVISAVANANTFTITISGEYTTSGKTVGSAYFLSEVTDGLITTTPPVIGTSIRKPIGYATSATTFVVQIQLGIQVANATAPSASKLSPGANINTVLFDGTAPITVTADATTLTGGSINTTVTGSSLTTVGTLANLNVTGTGVFGGNVGFGITGTPAARMHAISTTQQQRLGYDTSNYVTTTVAADGGTALAITGTGTFTMNKTLAITGNLQTTVAIVAGTAVTAGTDINVGSTRFVSWQSGRAVLGSPASGQIKIMNSLTTAGVTLDSVASTDTLYVKNFANTAGTTVQALNYQCDLTGGLKIKSGTNGRAGFATLVAGTVTVNVSGIGASPVILLTLKTSGGTIGDLNYSVTAGTSFTITSSSILDTSVVGYVIIEVA